ncbi:sugar ABC transporter substrate-binding protein [Clostridium estertheticum]|uniref:Maltodextrin-binding protein n=1 Tax=Clostridium estertheticum TaxID=238834 RepID=A0A5N7IK37_9CLOT|nr:maltose ABC transporter substrate-binding protein [Clostridium estertheticum]MBU3170563.1 maltose ABC transporter substrate-binding protein [Clostridium estertheticum]MPQ30665.1 maltose ABC transporter substrate-binding protein [Clostridium estertheticum]MPQ61341.1 maltose ABC transporter substrate-binding protein [Clostridium estertheticum]
MKKIKSILAIAMISTLVVGTLAGCGSKAADKSSSVDSSKPVSLAFWEQDDASAQKALDKLITDFHTANPTITVKRTHYETEDLRKNFSTASLGTTGPDIVLSPNDNLGVFVPGSLVQPIDTIVGADFMKTLDPKTLEAGKFTGKQYMIPDRNGNELLVSYNKKLVKTPPKTFEELEAMGLKLKKEGKADYGLVFNEVEPFFSIGFLGAYGGKVFDDVNAASPKPTLNTPAVTQWMTFMKKIHSEGLIPKESDAIVADNLFKGGKAAFIINGPWGFADYKKAGIDLGIMSIPTINGKSPAPYSAVKGYTVSAGVKDANKMAAVKKFLMFVNSKDAQLQMVDAHQQIPTNLEAIKDAKITGNPLIAGQKDQLSKATPMPNITQMRAIWDAIKPVQQNVLSGKTKPEDAGAIMQKKAEEGIKALGL